MDVTRLLEDPARRAVVTKAGQHPMIARGDMTFTFLLPPSADRRIQVTVGELAPRTEPGEPMAHGPGELFGWVLEGRLTFVVDDEVYLVEEGDTFACSYDRPHSFGNPSAHPARAMIVLAPPVDFAAVDSDDDR